MASIQVDDVLSRLDARPTRRGWSARCPVSAHADRFPSLSIAAGRDGRVLLHCWAGCRYEEILRAIGIERQRPVHRTAWESPLDRARREILAEARRQPWYREDIRLLYQISDAIRARSRAVHLARQIATAAGDRPEAWRLLATAAVVEREAQMIEMRLDEVMA